MGKIKIKKENKGKFTSYAKSKGESIQKAAHEVLKNSINSTLRKRANFAINAKKWHKAEDGITVDPQLKPFAYQPIENPNPKSRVGDILPKPATDPSHGVAWDKLLQLGVAGVDALIPPEFVKPLVNRPLNSNPNAYGTGSQAIYKYGGKIAKIPMYADGGDPTTPVYKTQAEVDIANAFAKSFAQRKSLSARAINPEDVYVAKKPGDAVVPFVDQQGNPYSGKPAKPLPLTVPNDINLEDIKSFNGQYWYNHPQTGDVVMVDPAVVNTPRFRKPQPQPQDIAKLKNGGSLKGKKIAADGASITPLTDDTLQFSGPSHADGGIPLNYGGKKIEVEGGETAYQQAGGDMTIWGNMTNPLTGRKFKEDSKVLAKKEQRVDKLLDKGVSLVNNSDTKDPLEELSFNSGKAMMIGGAKKKQELKESKDHMVALQQAMLQQADELGIDPQAFSKGKIKAKNGATVKYDDGGKPRYNKDFVDVQNLVKKGAPKFSSDFISYKDMVSNSPYNKEYTSAATSPEGASPIDNTENPDTSLDLNYQPFTSPSTTNAKKLSLTQIAPELHALASNRVEPVRGQQYNPQLYSPYQVSFQDQLNENQSTFNGVKNTLSSNPEALSVLAGQQYSANSSVLGSQFRTNQQISQDINNKNIQLLNEAKLKNIDLSDTQYVRQAQAKANTKTINNTILNSIAGKVKQNQLEQQTIKLYENMYPYYRFNPQTGKAEYMGPDGASQIALGGMPGMGTAGNSTVTTHTNAKGQVSQSVRTQPTDQQSKLHWQAIGAQKKNMYTLPELPFKKKKADGGTISLAKLMKTKYR